MSLAKWLKEQKEEENKEIEKQIKILENEKSKDKNKDNNEESENETSYNCVEFFSKLLHCRNQIHVYHWQAESLSIHLALENLYKKLLKITDKLVEVRQGQIGEIIKGYKIDSNIDEEYKPLEHVEELIKYIKDNRNICFESSNTEIQNIIDELLAIVERNYYKIKFLK